MGKVNRILSTAGVSPTNATRLRSYCNLIQRSLIDRWLFADEFVDSHVCFVRDDYLNSLGQDKIEKAQVIVVVNVKGNHFPDMKYQISSPIKAKSVRDVLNQISKDVEFKSPKQVKKSTKSVAKRFINAFSGIRKSLFKRKESTSNREVQLRKNQFVSRITQKMNINEAPPKSIVLLGSPGSGKTTFVKSASKGKALDSDVSATDSVAQDKDKTTVGIDYALIRLSDNHKIKLFGTPGQVKFNFVWDMVGKSANAFVILVDMSRPEPLSYLKFYLRFIQSEIKHNESIFCALTHTENYTGDISSFIDIIEDEFPKIKSVYSIDGRSNSDTSVILNDIYVQLGDDSLASRLEKLSLVK